MKITALTSVVGVAVMVASTNFFVGAAPIHAEDALITRMADTPGLIERGNIIHNVGLAQREEHHTKHPINEQIEGRGESVDHIQGEFNGWRRDDVEFAPYDVERRGDDTQTNDVNFGGFRRRYEILRQVHQLDGAQRRGEGIFDDPINEGTHRRGNDIEVDCKKPGTEWSKPDPSVGNRRANDIHLDYKKPGTEWSKPDPSVGNRRSNDISVDYKRSDIPWDPKDPFIGNKRNDVEPEINVRPPVWIPKEPWHGNKRNDVEPEINVRPPVEKSRRPYPKREDKSINAEYDLDINVKHPVDPDLGNK